MARRFFPDHDHSILGLVALLSLIAAGVLMEEIIRPLQTLANVVSALRESDYSFRARGGRQNDALGELAIEINAFADLLQTHRLEELEATALLRCVISSMDAPVLAFDPGHRLRLINPAAERIFHLSEQRALGSSAEDLRLAALLNEPDRGIMVLPSKGYPVHWMVRRSSFRQRGIPHTLSGALRRQHRPARAGARCLAASHSCHWSRDQQFAHPHQVHCRQPSFRIHIHPVKVQTMDGVTVDEDMFSLDRGLNIIENRAQSLNRFIQAYRQLAQLPPPALQPVPLPALMERAVALETRVSVRLKPGPDIILEVDPGPDRTTDYQPPSQCCRSGVGALSADAASKAQVTITWQATAQAVIILIEDNGIGLTNPSNLFVPFYTTKPGGSGIGLALARQICEVHGGVLQVANRAAGPGCGAEIRLPLGSSREFIQPQEEGKPAENNVT